MNGKKIRSGTITGKDVAEFAWCGFALLTDVDCLRMRAENLIRSVNLEPHAKIDPEPLRRHYAEMRGRGGNSAAKACAEYAAFLIENGSKIIEVAETNVRLSQGVKDPQTNSLRLVILSASGFFRWYAERSEELKVLAEKYLERGVYDMDFVRGAKDVDAKIMADLENS